MPIYWNDEPNQGRSAHSQKKPPAQSGRWFVAALAVLVLTAVSVRLALVVLVDAPAAPSAVTLVPRPSVTPTAESPAEAFSADASPHSTEVPSPTMPPRTFRLAVEQDLYAAFSSPLEALDRAHEDVIVLPYAPSSSPEDLLTQRLADGVVFWTVEPLPYGIPLAEIPYALVTHPQLDREGFSRSQLGAIADGLDETYTLVVPRDDQLVRAFLERDYWGLTVARVESWDEAIGYVAAHDDALAIVPWEVVDQRVRLAAIDGRRADPTSTADYPFCHRIWLLESSAMLMPDAALEELRRELAHETSPTVRLVAVGDVMLGGYCAEQMSEQGPLYPFGDPGLTALILEADVALGNLASPLSRQGELLEGVTAYRGDPTTAEVLARVGLDVMSVANEQVSAFGPEALLDTINALREAGIEAVGAGATRDAAYAPVVVERNGLALAILALNAIGPEELAASSERAGVAWLDDSRALWAVAEASRKADLVVVSCHWGEPHTDQATADQITVGEALLGAGADLVIGHHPHTVQAISYQPGGVVAYSLGDLVYHPWSEAASAEGVVLVATLGDGAVRSVELVPYRVESCRPRLLEGGEAAAVLSRASALATSTPNPTPNP